MISCCLKSQGSNKSIISFNKPFKRLMSPELLSWANDTLLMKPELDRLSVTFSLSDSVAWPCSTVETVCQKQLFCPERTTDKHTKSYVWLSLRRGWAFSYIVPGESSPVTVATKWNRCFPTCMCELIGFCNILPSPWPLWRPCSLSVQQARIYSTFIWTTMPGQKVIATDFWPVSVNSVAHSAITVHSVQW